MILNGFNSDDYIYLKVIKNVNLPDQFFMDVKKGTIVKYQIKHLRKLLIRKCLKDYLDIEFNENCPKYSMLLQEVYKKIKVKYSCIRRVSLSQGTKIPFTPWIIKKFFANETVEWNKRILSKLDDCEISQISCQNNNLLPGKINKLKENIITIENQIPLITLAYSEEFAIPFQEGEIIDLNDLGAALFFSETMTINFLASCNLISEEEKLKLFQEEYQNRLPNGYRYFQLHDNFPLGVEEFTKFNFYTRKNNFDFDAYTFVTKRNYGYNKYHQENKNIRYLWINNDKILEDEILKIADEIPLAKAKELYNQEIRNKQEFNLKQEGILYCLKNKKRWNNAKRKNSNLTELEFMHQDLNTLEFKKNILYQKLINVLKQREITLNQAYTKNLK